MAETTAEQQAPPEPAKKKKAKPSTDARPKHQPPYAVVLHNDPVNDFEYVVRVLRKVFHYGGGKCFWMTLQAHVTGRSIDTLVHRLRCKIEPDPAAPRYLLTVWGEGYRFVDA